MRHFFSAVCVSGFTLAALIATTSTASAQQPAPAGQPPPPGAPVYAPPPGGAPPAGAAPAGAPPSNAPPPEDDREHRGFYMRLGAGYGLANTTVEAGGAEQKIKGTGIAFLGSWGGSIMPGLAIAGTMFLHGPYKPKIEFGGREVEADKSIFLLTLGPTVDWFPDPKGGLHVGAHIHYATLNAVNYTSGGWGGALFAGYDLSIGGKWGIGPLVQLMYASTSKDNFKDSTLSVVGMINVLDY